VRDHYPPIGDFFPKSEIDLTSTASVRVRRVDCRGEDLQLRVKLAYCPTEANGRVCPLADMPDPQLLLCNIGI
jgi:hypothetical protein